jgi:hypothetical protein
MRTSFPSSTTSITDMNPAKFYALVELAKSIDKATFNDLDTFSKALEGVCESIDKEVDALAKANNALLSEVRQTSRRKNPFAGSEEQDDPFSDLRHTIEGNNFLRVIFDVCRGIQMGFHNLLSTARGVRPAEFVLARKKNEGFSKWGVDGFDSVDDVQRMMFEFELNSAPLNNFMQGLLGTERAKTEVINLGRIINDHLDHYYQTLVRRHSTEGILIHSDPVTTDVAMSIFENVDAHGEIQDGKKPNEISAYSVRKAMIVADAVQNGLVGEFIRQPDKLINFVIDNVTTLWKLAEEMNKMFKPLVEQARAIVGYGLKKQHAMADSEFQVALVLLKDLDPRNVTYKEKFGLQTPEERFALKFQNETLKEITHLLSDREPVDNLIQYILRRKAELRDYYMDENSFYVCKVGAGNPFSGEAPGSLSVVPGTRPVVNLDEIIGSGFAEVKGFFSQVEMSSKWHDLFMATSPSRTADKSNVLLIGPMGCGKSEILRAVGGDKKSIGVFAQGSDFLTCWKGEAEKNPKRLFEECLRLQRESHKHVHILIDEIDTILNKDTGRESFGATNLVTEFQILMDGVVHYPHLSVWGATNNPERIPMPMLRRFSKVLIVGELAVEDRVKLLKHFIDFMPTEGFKGADWMECAEMLNGAVGDIVRKMCDHVWREKMTAFVESNQSQATKIVSWLNHGGVKFTIGDFDSKKRGELHALLRPYVTVKPADVKRSIEIHLENVAIHHEIKTAVETYDKARKFLANIKKTEVRSSAG